MHFSEIVQSELVVEVEPMYCDGIPSQYKYCTPFATFIYPQLIEKVLRFLPILGRVICCLHCLTLRE